MKVILLNNNKEVKVSDRDFDFLNRWKWRESSNGYAVRMQYISTTKINGKWTQKNKIIRMHRIIMNAPRELNVDHIDGDKLNNTRTNLRLCTHSNNQKNRKLNRNSTTGFKGVVLLKATNTYRALIQVNGKPIYLGTFKRLDEAVNAYNNGAIRYHGSFAQLNTI